MKNHFLQGPDEEEAWESGSCRSYLQMALPNQVRSQIEINEIKKNKGTPVAQKAKLGFKLLLLERLNENLKQKHF